MTPVVNNYLKLTLGSHDELFFFRDEDPEDAQRAYNDFVLASARRPRAFGCIFRRPVSYGPWAALPVIGEPS